MPPTSSDSSSNPHAVIDFSANTSTLNSNHDHDLRRHLLVNKRTYADYPIQLTYQAPPTRQHAYLYRLSLPTYLLGVANQNRKNFNHTLVSTYPSKTLILYLYHYLDVAWRYLLKLQCKPIAFYLWTCVTTRWWLLSNFWPSGDNRSASGGSKATVYTPLILSALSWDQQKSFSFGYL